MTGRMSLNPSIRTTRVSPSARPPSAASTRAARPSAASESATRHSPPRNRICASGSLNVDRLVNCSGRLIARTRAASGAHRGPASRAARPPKVSTAHAPSSGATRTAAPVPPAQNPAASTIGSPAMNCGTTPSPTW
jgi:hypothetical protein